MALQHATSDNAPTQSKKSAGTTAPHHLYMVATNPPSAVAYRHQVLEPDADYTPHQSFAPEDIEIQATDLYDKVSNLHAINRYFHTTLEAYFADAEQQGLVDEELHYGLFLQLEWLKKLGLEVKDATRKLHAAVTGKEDETPEDSG